MSVPTNHPVCPFHVQIVERCAVKESDIISGKVQFYKDDLYNVSMYELCWNANIAYGSIQTVHI